MKKILVVGGGPYQVPLIKRIIELGHEAYCVDGNKDAIGFTAATGYKNLDVLNREACLAYARNLSIDAVMTYGATITLPTVSYIGEKLGLSVLPAETAGLAINKYKIKERLAASGCNVKGDFYKLHSREERPKLMLPCVLKPCDGSGSKGVSIVHHEHDLANAIQYAFDSARYGEVYAESFIQGDEYSVEAFVAYGEICIYAIVKTTLQKLPDGEISYGHRVPFGIDTERKSQIVSEVKKAIIALKITMGSVNFDVIVSSDDQKAYIIDCGIRVGQNLIASHLVPLSCGVNVMDNAIALALGEKTDTKQKFHRCIATRLLIYRPGTIVEIKNMEPIMGKKGIVDVVLRKKVGDIQLQYRDKTDTCGWVITTGSTPDEAEYHAIQAKKLLEDYIIIR